MSGWKKHEDEQFLRVLHASPEERLRWLEGAKKFAFAAQGLAQKQDAKVAAANDAVRYEWGNGCQGWRLVDHDAQSVVLERMPRGTQERRHRHLRARQVFFVTTGSLVIELEGKHHSLGPNEALEVAATLAHTVSNVSEGDAEFLVVSTPSTRNDRVDDEL